MLGLLVKKSDNLYIHMKYDLLDTKGFFRDEKKIYEGMFVDGQNASETRIWPSKCERDATDDAKDVLGSTKNREMIYVKKRIDLQFDFNN